MGGENDTEKLFSKIEKKIKDMNKEQMLTAGLIAAGVLIFILIIVAATAGGSTKIVQVPAPTVAPTATIGSLLTDATAAKKMRDNFMSGVEKQKISDLVQEYSRVPHMAGTDRNTELATMTAQKYREYGFDDVRIEQIPATLMTIDYRSVNATDPTTGAVLYTCLLEEPNIQNQSDWSKALPPTNGLTGDGKVTNAPIVWVNYGRQEDFDAIADVNLTGTIVVVKYGQIFRGNKVRLAQLRGAAGVIITYDPFDVVKGPVFPDGPWSTNMTVQRGSVLMGEGDPRTPSWPSQFDGPMLSMTNGDLYNESLMEGTPLPSIPVQPMGYGDVVNLFRNLGGKPLPQAWSNTNFTNYFRNGIGPGPATASMEVRRTLVTRTITNVFATIRGSIEPDRTVAMGSHRDAWTYGAVDPISGHSTVLEIGRNLGRLHKTGWTPRRTIQLCSWDAEEWGLYGSVEYVETAVELLRQRGVIYLNLDTAVTGRDYIFAGGPPSLGPILREAAKEVDLPGSTTGAKLDSILQPMEAPGSGSDHCAWIQLAGVPVLESGITSNDGAYQAVYHSNYDNFYWVSKFGDPGFAYHAAMAQFYGQLVMRFADDNFLPFHIPQYADNVTQWVNQYKTNAKVVAIPGVNFTFMDRATAVFRQSAVAHQARVDAAKQKVAANQNGVSPYEIRAINDINMGLERVFLGYSERETGSAWYKHVLFTPNPVNQYGSSVMPLIAEAVATKDPIQVNFAIGRVAQFIFRAAQYVNSSFVFPPPN